MSDFSVRAILSATDRGFSSTLKGATGAVSSLGDKIKNGLGFGFLMGAGQQAFSALTSGVSGLIGEIDSANASWKTFNSNLSMLGWDSGDIKSAESELKKFAQQTVYSSSDMATTFSQLAAVGVDDTAELVKGFGGLAAAAENPQQAMKSLSQQATQMAAKPTVAWEDFKIMLEQTPAGIAAVAKAMDMSTSDMVSAVQDGTISTEEFFEAIKKAGGAGTELYDLATEAKTIGQAMDGLKETVSNALLPAFDALSNIGIGAVESLTEKLGGIDGQAIADRLTGWIDKARPLWDSLSTGMSNVWKIITGLAEKAAPMFAGLGGAFGGAAKKIADSLAKIDAEAVIEGISSAVAKAKPYLDVFKNIITSVAGAIAKVVPYLVKFAKVIGNFFLNNSETISKFIPYVLGAVGAFKGFKLVKGIFGGAGEAVSGATESVRSGVSKIAQILKGAGEMFQGIGRGISTAFVGIGQGIKTAFVGIGQAMRLANPVNFLALGAAIFMVAAGLALMGTQGEGIATILEGIGSVVVSVGTAIGNILATAIKAVATAMLIMAPVMPIIAQSLVMLTPLVYAFGAAFSMAAVAVGQALSLIVVAIGEAIARIIESLAPIVQIVSELITGIVQILIDGVVRIIEALSPILPKLAEIFSGMVEVVSSAIVQIVEALAPYVPELTKMIEATSLAIQSICSAFISLVEQISPVIESVTTLVSQLGESLVTILGGVAEVVTSIGDSIATVFDSIGGAISGVIDSVAGVFDSLGNAALNAGEGFKKFASGLKTITDLPLLDMGASLLSVGKSIKTLTENADGLSKMGNGMSDVVSGLKSLTKNFESVTKAGTKAGKELGQKFTQSVKTGMKAAESAAKTALKNITSSLRSGYSSMYQSGAFISQGFANGMRSQLSAIRTAAAQMAEAADEAVRAKAKIQSPSRVSMALGEYWGEGFVNGISSMVKDAWNAAQDLVSLPNVATPNLALAYGGELSSDYSYSRYADYTIEVPLNVDGREFARATATYTQDELNRKNARENRKKGRV